MFALKSIKKSKEKEKTMVWRLGEALGGDGVVGYIEHLRPVFASMSS